MSFIQCECGATAWKASAHHVILIDADAVGLASDRAWWLDPKDAPRRVKGTRRKGDPTNVALHRVVMGATEGQLVDHINGNPLDNRRCNLRFASAGQNSMNCKPKRNGLKGVHIHRVGVWRAQISVNGVRHSLGTYPTEAEAHAAYVAAAQKLQGAFFPVRVVSRPRKKECDRTQHRAPAVRLRAARAAVKRRVFSKENKAL